MEEAKTRGGENKERKPLSLLRNNEEEIVFLTIIGEQLLPPFSRSKRTKIKERAKVELLSLSLSLDPLKQSRYSFREFSKAKIWMGKGIEALISRNKMEIKIPGRIKVAKNSCTRAEHSETDGQTEDPVARKQCQGHSGRPFFNLTVKLSL